MLYLEVTYEPLTHPLDAKQMRSSLYGNLQGVQNRIVYKFYPVRYVFLMFFKLH